MQWSRYIHVFSLIVVIALCGKAVTYDHFAQAVFLSSEVNTTDAITVKVYDESTFSKATPVENCYINTPAHSSVSTRLDERNFSNSLFLSIFEWSRIQIIPRINQKIQSIQIARLGLKIIYPYHYFW